MAVQLYLNTVDRAVGRAAANMVTVVMVAVHWQCSYTATWWKER